MLNAKKYYILIFAWIFIVYPVFALAEKNTFPAFSVVGILNNNGSLKVSEEFIYDFGDEPKHGLFRNISLISSNGKRWYKINSINIFDKNKEQINFELGNNEGNVAQIKIGHPNITLTGTHYYNLRYTIDNIANSNELNWNVINLIREPIEKFEAKLFLPTPIPVELATTSCFIIDNEEKMPCDTTNIISKNKVVGFTIGLENISKKEVFLSIKYPKSVVINDDKPNIFVKYNLIKIGLMIFFVILLAFVIYLLKVNKDKLIRVFKNIKTHPVSPELFSYLERAVYFNGCITKEDIIATIIDFEERGYISLEQIAHPVGINEFIDYSIKIIDKEIDNDAERVLISSIYDTNSLSEWLSKNFENIKPEIERLAQKNIEGIKMYKIEGPLPRLIGFKIF